MDSMLASGGGTNRSLGIWRPAALALLLLLLLLLLLRAGLCCIK
jgi:hypothetical protein